MLINTIVKLCCRIMMIMKTKLDSIVPMFLHYRNYANYDSVSVSIFEVGNLEGAEVL